MAHHSHTDIRRLAYRAEILRARLLRRWATRAIRRLYALLRHLHAESELRALDERELHDLGLDRGGIAHAARWGRLDS